jgi:NAD(P)-dependent dehydrogenase (short-subunit alcohol dehydrogenase family)
VTHSRRFEERVCLVTGSTGIAAAAARALAAEGGLLFVASRSPEHAEALAKETGGAWAQADLSGEEAVDSIVRACVERFGRIDCVYNVAGISARRFGDGPLHEMSIDGWRAVIDANLTSMFLVCRAAVRQMLGQPPVEDRRRGVILNMGSVIARSPSVEFFSTHGYAATKGAIESFSRSLAAYYAPHGIRVNVVAPGLVATPMSERAQGDPRVLEFVTTKQPLAGGPMQPDDLVGTALYLLSDDSRMVTGQVIDVDAGWGLTEG